MGLRSAGDLSEVLDRMLDKGIVIDAVIDLSIAGITLAHVDSRVIVTSIETYLAYHDRLAERRSTPRPLPRPAPPLPEARNGRIGTDTGRFPWDDP